MKRKNILIISIIFSILNIGYLTYINSKYYKRKYYRFTHKYYD